MKKHCLLQFFALAFLTPFFSWAQIINPREALEQKSKDRANVKIDQSLDQGLNTLEEGIGSIFKKKKKKTESVQEQKPSESQPNARPSSPPSLPAPLKAYSKFDFVQGDKILVYDDFSQDNLGDFPAKWETNASGEVVTLGRSPEKWLFLNSNGWFSPEYLKQLPENFTLEMDVYMNYCHWWGIRYAIGIVSKGGEAQTIDYRGMTGQSSVIFTFSPRNQPNSNSFTVYKDGLITMTNDQVASPGFSIYDDQNNMIGTKVHLAFWRQKNRLRIYANENKIIDNPSAFKPGVSYDRVVFNTFDLEKDEAGNFDQCLISNLRLAVGAPDTRNKLLTEGKWVTRGITFETNSAELKPESFGALKEIAQVLSENPSVNVKVVGHTDNTGDPNSNLKLSMSRAQKVISTLTSEFGIPQNQMVPEGKGATEPTASNNTLEGKAQNRRVEFIKR